MVQPYHRVSRSLTVPMTNTLEEEGTLSIIKHNKIMYLRLLIGKHRIPWRLVVLGSIGRESPSPSQHCYRTTRTWRSNTGRVVASSYRRDF
jgi:hypothetical protein